MFKTGKAPEFVQIVSPLDGEEDVWKAPELSWEFECADVYDVYLGKNRQNWNSSQRMLQAIHSL